jgi:hypothetical protein
MLQGLKQDGIQVPFLETATTSALSRKETREEIFTEDLAGNVQSCSSERIRHPCAGNRCSGSRVCIGGQGRREAESRQERSALWLNPVHQSPFVWCLLPVVA